MAKECTCTPPVPSEIERTTTYSLSEKGYILFLPRHDTCNLLSLQLCQPGCLHLLQCFQRNTWKEVHNRKYIPAMLDKETLHLPGGDSPLSLLAWPCWFNCTFVLPPCCRNIKNSLVCHTCYLSSMHFYAIQMQILMENKLVSQIDDVP